MENMIGPVKTLHTLCREARHVAHENRQGAWIGAYQYGGRPLYLLRDARPDDTAYYVEVLPAGYCTQYSVCDDGGVLVSSLGSVSL